MPDPSRNGFDEADATIGIVTSRMATAHRCGLGSGKLCGGILRCPTRSLGDKSTLWTSTLPFVKRRRSSRWFREVFSSRSGSDLGVGKQPPGG